MVVLVGGGACSLVHTPFPSCELSEGPHVLAAESSASGLENREKKHMPSLHRHKAPDRNRDLSRAKSSPEGLVMYT